MASTLHTLKSLSQNPDEMQVSLEQLRQFRQQLYSSLAYRGDTIMDLLDALSSNTTAKSVVELSLNPLFRRGYVYQPNTIASNKPVTIGHQYSTLVLFPENLQASAPPWVVPLSLRRVTTQETKRSIGVQQVNLLLNDQTLPFHQQLFVQVVDSEYSVSASL
jgi:hypothetical protein